MGHLCSENAASLSRSSSFSPIACLLASNVHDFREKLEVFITHPLMELPLQSLQESGLDQFQEQEAQNAIRPRHLDTKPIVFHPQLDALGCLVEETSWQKDAEELVTTQVDIWTVDLDEQGVPVGWRVC